LTFKGVKPSFLASEPSSTYTLIGFWCKSMSKMFLITFFALLFLKNYKMLGFLWRALSLLLGCFMVLFFIILPTWATWKMGHHYWIIYMHESKWPLRRSFICPGPLSSIRRNHYMGPKLCLSIPSKWYPHHGPYEWNYPCLWPPFDLISLSWAQGQNVKVQALKSIMDLFRHKKFSGLHFGHKWFMHFGCANGV
jgi:hypothetical protein